MSRPSAVRAWASAALKRCRRCSGRGRGPELRAELLARGGRMKHQIAARARAPWRTSSPPATAGARHDTRAPVPARRCAALARPIDRGRRQAVQREGRHLLEAHARALRWRPHTKFAVAELRAERRFQQVRGARFDRRAWLAERLAGRRGGTKQPRRHRRAAQRQRQLAIAAVERNHHAGAVADRAAQRQRFGTHRGCLVQPPLAHGRVAQPAERHTEQPLVACRTKQVRRACSK